MDLPKLLTLTLAVALSTPILGAASAPSPSDPAAIEFFEKKIRPVLVDNCYNCHSANTNAKGGLRVDDRNGLLAGGDKGAAIVPGNADKSLLLAAVNQTGELKMPPKKHLTDEQIADLTTWIRNGAAWPQVKFTIAAPPPKYEKLRKEHWAWQPLGDGTPPVVHDASWPADGIDRFVLEKLEAKGLKPVGDADKLQLIRRVTFDLTGLPPAPAEIDAFVNDNSPAAFEKVVDRLLASKNFGEKWGRHWLDVARYAESTGSSRNLPYPQAWRYRDYVIDAVNNDKPYDQFIREQIAGDLLPAGSENEHNQHLVATGFLALGVKDVNQRFKVRYIMDNVDEQIDTVSRSILALTASCARCHDHKFDPIPTTDYYALAGIFQSSDLCAGLRNKMGGGGMAYYDTSMLLTLADQKSAKPEKKPAVDPKKLEQVQRDLEQAKKEWFAIRGTKEGLTKDANGQNKQRPYRLKFEKLEAEYAALQGDSGPVGEIALGVRDSKTIADTEIRIRGEAEKLGPVVPRGFLSVVQFADEPKVNPQHSGRLELAEWLTAPQNPLTPRVIVNRVWAHLFGQGFVKSVDNFGTTGDVPSHPELLDYLARQFAGKTTAHAPSGEPGLGWSVKRLVREIVLSRTYRLSADESATNVEVDPSDRLLWRHTPRRLDAEEIRDATLAVAGKLDPSRPAGSPADQLKVRELTSNGPDAARFAAFASADAHRSVYLPLLRGLTPISLEVFDFADQGMVTGQRDPTTVAIQALYLLNDPFQRRQSLALADRLLAKTEIDDKARIDAAYRLTLGRTPTSYEVARVEGYLADYEKSAAHQVASAPTPAKTEAPLAFAVASGSDAAESGGANPAIPAAAKMGDASNADTEKAAGPKGGKPAAPINPDEVIHEDAPVKEEAIVPANARAAAWASFCQALYGSAEFRYLK
jgi:cytochrome c553